MDMIEFAIKSTICLTVLYGFYYFLLQNVKIPNFNRFYLLFSLVFAMIIPMINIQMHFNLTVSPNIREFSNATGILIQGEEVTGRPIQFLTFQTTCIILYIIISSTLLLRFALNIYKIIRLIRTSTILDNLKTQIVLVEKKTLPYSFFRYIFVNRLDYENGRIEKELIIHEQAHCMQFHSIDILTVELIKIILWFNPFVWLFKKAMQLNHEYLADNKVLSNHDLNDYQNTLINLVFRNNSTYLASNFNYSLTKKRLIMMTKNNSSGYAIFRKIATIPLFLILAITLALGQENKPKDSVMNFENEWWSPILKKHNIEPSGFNNFGKVFEMGTKNTINNRIVTLENAFFLIKNSNGEYYILKSPLAYHDLDKNIITCDKGTMETFKIKSEDTESFEKQSFEKLKLQINDGNPMYTAESVSGLFKTKK
jgi:hypothetical protein